MKLTCQREALLAACQIAGNALPGKDVKPVLKNFKAVAAAPGPDVGAGADPAGAGAVTILATDLEVGIRLAVPGVTVHEPGEALLPASRLVAILRETSGQEVTLDAEPAGCLVQAPGAEFELLGEDPAHFPDVPEFEGEAYHEITAGSLRELVRRTLFASADDATRFSMNGVVWELSDGCCRLVATDGKRVAAAEGVGTSVGGHATPNAPAAPIVPAKAMALLDRILADDPGGAVKIAFRKTEALFRTARAAVYTRLLEGRFPDWRLVMPKQTAASPATLGVAAFASAVRQAAIVTQEDAKRVNCAFAPGKVVLSAHGDKAGRSKVELAAAYDGPPVTVGFNPAYLTELLRALPPDGEVVASLIDHKTPVLFRLAGAGDHYRHLVMPLT